MAKIPQTVLDRCPLIQGLELLGQGKVRQTYALPGHPDKLLVVATKRISAFDFVLDGLIEDKGACLTAVNYYWSQLLKGAFETDVIACGAGIDEYLPERLRNDPYLQMVATVVKKYESPDVEDVFRFMLLGSSVSKYEKTGKVCGHVLPPGLKKGDFFPIGGIYTPTTKAKTGHDENLDADKVAALLGFEHERRVLQIAHFMKAHLAERGLILADGKMEMFGNILIDEKGTSDSCRVFLKAAYDAARKKGKLADPLDKEYVRNWCRSVGIDPDKLDPEKPEDIQFVHSKKVPADVQNMTTQIYRFFAWKLFGMKLEQFQSQEMGIKVDIPTPTIDIVVGSESDKPQLEAGLRFITLGRPAKHRVITSSCHRNPDFVHDYARDCNADVVIAGAGEAAALPGVLKGWLCHFGKPHIPVIGVAFKGKDWKADMAARLSIENLPGQPVEMDKNGCAYFGPEGFESACISAVADEFLPKDMEKKPVQVGDFVG